MVFLIARSIFLLGVLLFAMGTRADAGGQELRARYYDEVLSAPDGEWWNRAIGRRIAGVRNVKTALPGVLYRGGGPGGKVPISESGLRALCEAGFDTAYYLYSTGFEGTKTVRCTGPDGDPNSLVYRHSGFISNDEKKVILKDAYRRILDPKARPIFVHCWNGYHASGEIAAAAYMQFCGWDAKEAREYWMRNQTGAPPNTRLAKFEEIADLRITTDLQSVLCPRPGSR